MNDFKTFAATLAVCATLSFAPAHAATLIDLNPGGAQSDITGDNLGYLLDVNSALSRNAPKVWGGGGALRAQAGALNATDGLVSPHASGHWLISESVALSPGDLRSDRSDRSDLWLWQTGVTTLSEITFLGLGVNAHGRKRSLF